MITAKITEIIKEGNNVNIEVHFSNGDIEFFVLQASELGDLNKLKEIEQEIKSKIDEISNKDIEFEKFKKKYKGLVIK